MTWLDADTLWRGPAPPEGPWSEKDWIEVPREHYIPITKPRLRDALKRSAPSEETVLDLLDALIHFQNHEVLNEIKEDFEFFDPFLGDKARQGVPEAELVQRERRFLAMLLRVLERANFRPLRESEFRRAVEHDYLFDVPAEVNWAAHDASFLEGFFAEADGPDGAELRHGVNPSLRAHLGMPEILARHALVFTRGVGIDRSRGLFLFGKIDLLLGAIAKVVFAPAHWLVARIRKRPKVGPLPELPPPPRGKQRTWARRTNLKSETRPSTFFRKLLLQEPTFGRLIGIFRLKPAIEIPAWTEGYPGLAWLYLKLVRPKPAKEKDWTIIMKLFRDIPMADAEIVFPAKKIRMKSYDLAMLIVTAVTGIAALVKSAHTDSNLALIILGVVGAYLFKLLNGYRLAWQAYTARMTKDLYFKNLDNSIGVIHYLVDALEEQEWKEVAIAWTLLAKHGPMSATELDARAEVFLKGLGEEEIDFEVEDALQKLTERFPIVEKKDGLYRTVPSAQAVTILDRIVDSHHDEEEPARTTSR